MIVWPDPVQERRTPIRRLHVSRAAEIRFHATENSETPTWRETPLIVTCHLEAATKNIASLTPRAQLSFLQGVLFRSLQLRDLRPVPTMVLSATKAALKPPALQTLREIRGATEIAQRLECACLYHRFRTARYG